MHGHDFQRVVHSPPLDDLPEAHVDEARDDADDGGDPGGGGVTAGTDAAQTC